MEEGGRSFFIKNKGDKCSIGFNRFLVIPYSVAAAFPFIKEYMRRGGIMDLDFRSDKAVALIASKFQMNGRSFTYSVVGYGEYRRTRSCASSI
mgnify:FL=1